MSYCKIHCDITGLSSGIGYASWCMVYKCLHSGERNGKCCVKCYVYTYPLTFIYILCVELITDLQDFLYEWFIDESDDKEKACVVLFPIAHNHYCKN